MREIFNINSIFIKYKNISDLSVDGCSGTIKVSMFQI